jgi:hypothetical protein
MLLQEFVLEIKDKKGADNCVADHLSRMQVKGSNLPIDDYLRDDTFLKVTTSSPWYANLVNFMVTGYIPPGEDKKKFIHINRYHLWDDPYLFNVYADGLLRHCIPLRETRKILERCHSSPYGGHYGAFRTHARVWQSRFFWPNMHVDAKELVRRCPICQKHGNINSRDAMPLKSNLQVEIFDAWGIDFMGPFPASEQCEYILVAVDYVSKWVESLPYVVADSRNLKKMFQEIIFPRFEVPRVVINDGGSHFIDRIFKKCLSELGVDHRVATPYHPQTSGQA